MKLNISLIELNCDLWALCFNACTDQTVTQFKVMVIGSHDDRINWLFNILKIVRALSQEIRLSWKPSRIAFVKTFELSGTLMTPGIEARSE